MSEEEIKKEFGILKPDLEVWGKFVDQTIKDIIVIIGMVKFKYFLNIE